MGEAGEPASGDSVTVGQRRDATVVGGWWPARRDLGRWRFGIWGTNETTDSAKA